MSYRLAYQATLWRHFLDYDSFFPGDGSLCQVDIKENKTKLKKMNNSKTVSKLGMVAQDLEVEAADLCMLKFRLV